MRSEVDYVETGGTGRRRTTRQPTLPQRKIARCRKNRMNRSRHRNWNRVDAASLARWIVLTAFLALAGLSYVYLMLQLYHLGDRKKALENDVASVQIAALTSRSALQRRLKEGYLKMIPISEHNIVRLTMPAPPNGEDAIQPIANQPAGR